MKMESDFHMVKGEGETSYTTNSRLQVCKNALIVLSEVTNAMRGHPVELQFFLNDLPGNDFNQIFQSYEQLKNSTAADHNGERLSPFYIAGFLMIVKTVEVAIQFPDGLDGNGVNIYIATTTPPSVVKLYQEQFKKDFMLFLELRYRELSFAGQMVLTFLGRKNEDVYNGNMNYLYELLAQSLQSLVEKDLVNQKKLNSFNLPFYGASVAEVKEVVNWSGLFDINQINLFESSWDPCHDSEDINVPDRVQSGVNIAKSIRAVMETLFVGHFGESIIDALFKEFANKVAAYLQRENNTKYSIITLSLQRK
nr:unnamed protein product [Digitaria exilis]